MQAGWSGVPRHFQSDRGDRVRDGSTTPHLDDKIRFVWDDFDQKTLIEIARIVHFDFQEDDFRSGIEMVVRADDLFLGLAGEQAGTMRYQDGEIGQSQTVPQKAGMLVDKVEANGAIFASAHGT